MVQFVPLLECRQPLYRPFRALVNGGAFHSPRAKTLVFVILPLQGIHDPNGVK